MKFAGSLLRPLAMGLGVVGLGTGAYGLGRKQGFDSYNPPQVIDHLAASIQEARPDLTLNQVYYEAAKAFDNAVGNGKEVTNNFMYGIDADKQDTWERMELNPRKQYGYELIKREDSPLVPQGNIYQQNGKWVQGTPWEDGQSFTVY